LTSLPLTLSVNLPIPAVHITQKEVEEGEKNKLVQPLARLREIAGIRYDNGRLGRYPRRKLGMHMLVCRR
jgi:hypothetical protein